MNFLYHQFLTGGNRGVHHAFLLHQGTCIQCFGVSFNYNQKLDIINGFCSENGDPLVTMHYKDEESFRNDVKHLILKLNEITKKLKPLGPDAFPELKLTYYPR